MFGNHCWNLVEVRRDEAALFHDELALRQPPEGFLGHAQALNVRTRRGGARECGLEALVEKAPRPCPRVAAALALLGGRCCTSYLCLGPTLVSLYNRVNLRLGTAMSRSRSLAAAAADCVGLAELQSGKEGVGGGWGDQHVARWVFNVPGGARKISRRLLMLRDQPSKIERCEAIGGYSSTLGVVYNGLPLVVSRDCRGKTAGEGKL
jgi:hypothetical protein